MKTLKAFAIITVLFLASCGKEATELSELKQQKETNDKEIQRLEGEIKNLVALNDSIQVKIDKLDSTKKEVPPVKVVAQKIVVKDYESYFSVHGVVESGNNVLVIPEVSGVINAIYVQEGAMVKRGDRIARIDTKILENNLAELKTRSELAEELFKKQEALRKQNVGSEVDYLQAKNNYDALQSSMQTIRAQIQKAYVTAPINGKIDKVFPKKGEMSAPGSPLVRIVNTNSGFYIEADVSEAYFRNINEKDSIQIAFSSLNETYSSAVSYRGNFINPGNRTFKIRANLPKGEVFAPNLLGVITFRELFKKDAIVVPQKAIQTDKNNNYYVYAVASKEKGLGVARKYVSIVDINSSNEVLVESKALKPGDQIVTGATWDKLTSTDVVITLQK